ncbi:protein disulfide isomerase [Rhodnius prolixus]|uniref:protein disulfide isomerase n=1 Tax=Rhodnius prolixus TaxID=13249 RepID=UPI003D18C4DF
MAMIPKFLVSIYVLLLVGRSLSSEVTEEDGVLVLKQKNFEEVIATTDHILVEFYAPWCGHCKALAPQYAKAAEKLSELNSQIKLAKVDATTEGELAEKFNVRGYPTLKFFRKGQQVEYTGGRQAEDIVSWLLKKTGPPAKSLSSVDEAKAFIDEHPVVVIGYFKDPECEGAKRFLDVASTVDDHPFGIVSDNALFSEFSVEEDKVILYKKFDDGKSEFSGSLEDPNELTKFVASESLPLIVEFNHETAQKIFGGDIKSHLLLFLSKKLGHFDEHLEPIKPVAKEHKGELLFVVVNADETDHQRILEFFGIAETEVPTMRLIRLEEDMSKFKPDTDDLGPDSIKAFVKAFLEGTLKEHLLSQTLPEDWDKHPVKVLVSTNFDSVVFDTEKDVLVEFYAPWCGHCKQLAPIYDKLGEAFSEKKDVVIAKIDATANELEHTKISSFPTIKLYKKGDNQGINYEGERTLEGLTKFLESGGEYKGGEPASEKTEEEEEEEDDHPKKDEL